MGIVPFMDGTVGCRESKAHETVGHDPTTRPAPEHSHDGLNTRTHAHAHAHPPPPAL